ncbi:MAG: response regulator [Anaerolineae bacterium]|nr:response regulator [Anaerolineae bacterium]
MNKTQDTYRPGELPETFVDQVKQALEHLYDFSFLQHHPLAQGIARVATRVGEIPGQLLRRELISAIEALNPGPDVPFRAPHARLYNLLHLHYVESMTIQESAHELGISLRQAYRDLRRAERSVAIVLWERYLQDAHAESEEPRAVELSSLQAEMARVEPSPSPADVRPLLRRAREAVERMALQRSVHIRLELPPDPVIVPIDQLVGRQALTGILSRVVQQARPGCVTVTLQVEDEWAVLSLVYRPADAPVFDLPSAVVRLLEKQSWRMQWLDQEDGSRVVMLRMMMYGPAVLVIDDNEGLVELLQRYLTGHACRVVPAFSGREGLELAQKTSPDAIVLDIMMPEVDGWEVLQTLRTRPQTSSIPVIVCSVFNDPELAYSLGASLFLPKPVRRDDVLNALRELGVV